MKIDRKKLNDKIESIIGNGVIECEEVDVTTKKVMKALEELILAVERLRL